MRFLIMVQSPPCAPHAGGLLAYHFSKAVLKKGHKILELFFYQDGIEHAYFSLSSKRAWTHLAIPLYICRTAAQNRRLLTKKRLPGFKLSSLPQFFSALARADRCITF